MADLRISSSPSSLPAVQPARAEAAKAAQRAFFDAALRQASGVEPARRVTTADPQVQTTASTPRAGAAGGVAEGRALRPGSLLDIKV